MKIAIIGAGITGLATAWWLKKVAAQSSRPIELQIFESETRIGGNIRTERRNGFLCEWGPEGFLDNSLHTLQLIDELGLSGDLVRATPSSQRRFIWRNGKLREIYPHPLKFLFSDILPWSGKLRILKEFIIPPKTDHEDETIYAFAKRRIGEQAANIMIDAMASGVFAGNARELSLKSCFPRMAEFEERYGGLFKALKAIKKQARKTGEKIGGPASPRGTLTSFTHGLDSLINTLARHLQQELLLSHPIVAIRQSSNQFELMLENNSKHIFDIVILSLPACKTKDLLKDFPNECTNTLSAISFAPVVVVGFGYHKKDIPHPLQGFGYLIPRGQGPRTLGTLWSSSYFPNRAPEQQVLLRSIVGGAHWKDAIHLNDEEILKVALGDVRDILCIKEDPTEIFVLRHPLGIAQYTVGHSERLKVLKSMEEKIPGLIFAGTSYYGISLNDAVKNAAQITERIKKDFFYRMFINKKYELLVLPEKWAKVVVEFPEGKMGGYQTGRVTLKDGREFLVEVDNGQFIFYVEGYDYVPFYEDDIEKIIITNESINNEQCSKRSVDIFKKGINIWENPPKDSVKFH